MRLSRFFGGGKAEQPQEPDPPESEGDGADDGAEYTGEPEGDRDTNLDSYWRDRAADVIPGGASTGSKRPAALYGDAGSAGPTHYTRASGCLITTPAGETLIDCTMGLGSVAIGYADDAITRSVLQAAALGNVSGLSHTSEVEIADRLCDIIPCAEQVRFLKTGAEAVSAAVRIARTYTGKKRIVGAGYFGWHDWANDEPGVPPAARADVTRVPFDDITALERACQQAGSDLAAVVLEPVVERLPSREWLDAARRLVDAAGAVLVFDEIKTGFRLRPGGYQEYGDFEPDLATFGKAMANGYAISAVVGRAAVMEAAANTWISSTLASETTALAAVAGVLQWHEKGEVCDTLWKTGEEMMDAVRRAITASGIGGVSVEGIGPMWYLAFESSEYQSRFIELAVAQGVLFKRGPYNFPAIAHDDETLIEIERAASSAFVQLLEENEA